MSNETPCKDISCHFTLISEMWQILASLSGKAYSDKTHPQTDETPPHLDGITADIILEPETSFLCSCRVFDLADRFDLLEVIFDLVA